MPRSKVVESPTDLLGPLPACVGVQRESWVGFARLDARRGRRFDHRFTRDRISTRMVSEHDNDPRKQVPSRLEWYSFLKYRGSSCGSTDEKTKTVEST